MVARIAILFVSDMYTIKLIFGPTMMARRGRIEGAGQTRHRIFYVHEGQIVTEARSSAKCMMQLLGRPTQSTLRQDPTTVNDHKTQSRE